MKKTLILIALIFTFGSGVVLAQTDSNAAKDSTFYLVTKTDGGEFYGFILSDDGREILLQTATIGKIFIAKADIESITEVNTEKVNSDGTVKYEDFRATGPFTTRYYFTTNALPIEKDESYAMIHLYGPEAHFGITDNLSLGVMSSWIASPIGVAAKYSFDSETDVHYSLGTIIASSGYFLNAAGFAGLHWATVTKGDRRSNISFTGGVAYASLGRDDYLFGDRYIGPKYALDDYNYYSGISSKYNVPYEAQDEVLKKIGIRSTNGNFYYKRSNIGIKPSGVLSVAGIAPVGKKASFIFDALVFIRQAPYVSYVDTTLLNVSWTKEDWSGNIIDSGTDDFTIGKGTLDYAYRPTFILMPAMRFNQKHGKAFQVALSGVIFADNDGDVIAFPVPMISWLRQF
jgi:hypothetical protein